MNDLTPEQRAHQLEQHERSCGFELPAVDENPNLTPEQQKVAKGMLAVALLWVEQYGQSLGIEVNIEPKQLSDAILLISKENERKPTYNEYGTYWGRASDEELGPPKGRKIPGVAYPKQQNNLDTID